MASAPLSVFRTMGPRLLSNAYVVADRSSGEAVVIDSGGVLDELIATIEAWQVRPRYLLCTHHHPDHVAYNTELASRYGLPICGHAAERELFGHLDRELADGEEILVGSLRIRALHVPGHTLGQLAFVVDERELFSGDTLFRGSVGGTRGRGHTSYEDLRHSVMEVLLRLPPTTVVRPGHAEPTTVGRELAENPFVQFWLGASRPLPRPCTAFGRPATLLLRGSDYDGGTKCIVRFDDGRHDVVPGSRVTESPAGAGDR